MSIASELRPSHLRPGVRLRLRLTTTRPSLPVAPILAHLSSATQLCANLSTFFPKTVSGRKSALLSPRGMAASWSDVMRSRSISLDAQRSSIDGDLVADHGGPAERGQNQPCHCICIVTAKSGAETFVYVVDQHAALWPSWMRPSPRAGCETGPASLEFDREPRQILAPTGRPW